MPETPPTEEDLYQQMDAGRQEQRIIWKDGSINPSKKLNRKKLFIVIGVGVVLSTTLYFLAQVM